MIIYKYSQEKPKTTEQKADIQWTTKLFLGPQIILKK